MSDMTCGRCGKCRLCFLWHHSEPYRLLYGLPAPPRPPADYRPEASAVPASLGKLPSGRRSLPCVHRGGEVRRQNCPTCRGTVRLKVFGCAGGHGECTVANPLSGVACCATCGDYTPPAA